MIKEKAPVREHRGFSKRTTKSCIRRCIFMGKRTNTAKWMENQRRWQINVQKDGVRRSFTSSKPGRTGQREAKDHPVGLPRQYKNHCQAVSALAQRTAQTAASQNRLHCRQHRSRSNAIHGYPDTLLSLPFGLQYERGSWWIRFSSFQTHTYVSLAKTLPAGLVKEQVGHSSNMDTFGVYGHFVSTDNDHLGISLESLFSEIEK